jgi:hypothetical protein
MRLLLSDRERYVVMGVSLSGLAYGVSTTLDAPMAAGLGFGGVGLLLAWYEVRRAAREEKRRTVGESFERALRAHMVDDSPRDPRDQTAHPEARTFVAGEHRVLTLPPYTGQSVFTASGEQKPVVTVTRRQITDYDAALRMLGRCEPNVPWSVTAQSNVIHQDEGPYRATGYGKQGVVHVRRIGGATEYHSYRLACAECDRDD